MPRDWKEYLDGLSIENICDFHDKSYMRQAMLDNAFNQCSRELLKTIKQLYDEIDVMHKREIARNKRMAALEPNAMIPQRTLT